MSKAAGVASSAVKSGLSNDVKDSVVKVWDGGKEKIIEYTPQAKGMVSTVGEVTLGKMSEIRDAMTPLSFNGVKNSALVVGDKYNECMESGVCKTITGDVRNALTSLGVECKEGVAKACGQADELLGTLKEVQALNPDELILRDSQMRQ